MDQGIKNENLILTEEEIREILLEDIERNKWKNYWIQIKKAWPVYVMLVPVILFFFLFRYLPINSVFLAFHEYVDKTQSIFNNDFIGFYAFKKIMFGSGITESRMFWEAFRNTFTISMYSLLFGFPVPIILAIFFSEIRVAKYRSVVQVLSYLPNFVSTVVITSVIALMFAPSGTGVEPGILARLLMNLNMVPAGTNMMKGPEYFRSIYVLSGIWETSGYGSIVYFAAIMAISPTNYEAAKIDGASKLDQIRYITLPGISSTLTIMLILRIGGVLNVGYEKVMLLYQIETYSTADVLSTYVLRLGGLIENGPGGHISQSFAAAADLFNSIIAMFLVLGSNFISKRVTDTSLF